jgi:hypothetical protein
MKPIYFAHSYRPADARIVDFFAELLRSEDLLPALDPPSETVNAARLERHLRESDGMVVVLTRRDDGVSPHIRYEMSLALRAQAPSGLRRGLDQARHRSVADSPAAVLTQLVLPPVP